MMRALFSNRTIAHMRATQEQAMPDTCDLYRPAEATNALLETITTYPLAATASAIPCRFRDLNGEERVAATREGIDATALISLATDVDVRQNDRLSLLGSNWTVVHNPPVATWDSVQRVYVRLEEQA